VSRVFLKKVKIFFHFHESDFVAEIRIIKAAIAVSGHWG